MRKWKYGRAFRDLLSYWRADPLNLFPVLLMLGGGAFLGLMASCIVLPGGLPTYPATLARILLAILVTSILPAWVVWHDLADARWQREDADDFEHGVALEQRLLDEHQALWVRRDPVIAVGKWKKFGRRRNVGWHTSSR